MPASLPALLGRLLELVGESDEYFVSGSLSFLPLLADHREPVNDVDLAISEPLFTAARAKLLPGETLRPLRLAEVAVADRRVLGRLVSPRTAFAHLVTPDGLLDLVSYDRTAEGLSIRLGAGFSLRLPGSVLERVSVLSWAGLCYRAGPLELAFVPKALWYLRWVRHPRQEDRADLKHLEDLRRLAPLVDWSFVSELLKDHPLRWRDQPLPGRLWLDEGAILALRDDPFDRHPPS